MQRGPIIAAFGGLAAAVVLLIVVTPEVPTAPTDGPPGALAGSPDGSPTPAAARPGADEALPGAPRAPGGPHADPDDGRSSLDAPEGATAPDAARSRADATRPAPSAARGARTVANRSPGPRSASGRPIDDAAPGASGGGGGAAGDFDDEGAEVEADWLEDTMAQFLETVVPETAGEGLSRSCAADGRSCTFEGPVTDDSFVWRWIEAQAHGEVDLQGVQLSEVQFTETDQGRVFTFTATAP